jgi:iron complex outermembrane receptor protein
VVTNLHFNAGVRYDQYGDYDPSFNPRLALIYNPFEKSTVKALYGTAFRTPNFLEIIEAQSQDIQPEEITSYELVYEQGIGSHLRSSLSGYYNQMQDLLVFESGQYRNFDAETRGMELALEGSWASGIRGRASYTFQETDNHSVGWKMPDSPNHLVKLNLSVPIVKEKLFASLEFQYTSDRRSLHTEPVGNQLQTSQGAEVDGFGVLNFTLFSQNLLKNLEFSASVYNLLDESYADPATRNHLQDEIPQDGRGFRLKLTYRF